MALINLATEFTKTLNALIPHIDTKDSTKVLIITELINKVSSCMKGLENTEEAISHLINLTEINKEECKDVVYLRKDGNLLGIISRDVIKPRIFPVKKLSIECNCLFSIERSFLPFKECIVINTESELRSLDSELKEVVLNAFEHSYRTSDPFVCYISVYTPEGYIYIIDAIRFREIIPQLRLLKCNVMKVICSQFAAKCLIEDFGSVNCYRAFNIPESHYIIDWRIRPLNETMISVICEETAKGVEMLNLGLELEEYCPNETDEVSEFMERFEINESQATLIEKLFKLRAYLARSFKESVQYVLTDSQLAKLISNMPTAVEEIESLFPYMSSVMRLHSGDFLIILKGKSKVFSIENLKNKDFLNSETNQIEEAFNYKEINDSATEDEY